MKKFVILMLIVIGVIILGMAIGIIDSGNNPKNNEDLLNQIENILNFNQILNTETNNNNVNEENTALNEVSSETFEEEPKTEKEKAIEIVKTDWTGSGNSQNVKFIADGMDSNGRYIIAVRDQNTTEALAFYTVNVNDKTFTKREMN